MDDKQVALALILSLLTHVATFLILVLIFGK